MLFFHQAIHHVNQEIQSIMVILTCATNSIQLVRSAYREVFSYGPLLERNTSEAIPLWQLLSNKEKESSVWKEMQFFSPSGTESKNILWVKPCGRGTQLNQQPSSHTMSNIINSDQATFFSHTLWSLPSPLLIAALKTVSIDPNLGWNLRKILLEWTTSMKVSALSPRWSS